MNSYCAPLRVSSGGRLYRLFDNAERRRRVLAFLWLRCGSVDCGCCWQRGTMQKPTFYIGLVYAGMETWNFMFFFLRNHVWICGQTRSNRNCCFWGRVYGQTFWIKTLKWPHSNPSLDWSWDQVREGDGLVDDSSISRNKTLNSFVIWSELFGSTLFSNP